jgi:hypothetical protein
MNAQDQLISGINRIHDVGWGKFDLETASGSVCLLGAIGTRMDEYGCYEQTPGAEVMSRAILKECELCADRVDRYRPMEPTEIVYSHNDVCRHTQEDALLILKKALEEV